MLYRSGADSYPSTESISPALTSLLLCAAEVLVTLSYIGYGFWKGLGLVGSAQLYVEDFGIAGTEDHIGESGVRTTIIK